ncbi:hypothetical protein A6U87_12255 [Rhizobium sp. AC44/96]|uniref:sugar dehydrogenase complex small subunit n=1 Tax=Rhizobium sp. AC44/96 TaxID=1841654 RepID=UPI00080F7338|nr:sugar dehydrogenase complex small subunit [Rhizobium sp. AC44/96]OCJ08020.1 hypothetical protein A6U87_12255 [Rhizobium sp. AC44/96]
MPSEISQPAARLAQGVSRRTLLRGSAAIGGLAIIAAIGAPLPAAAADSDMQTFTRLSEFLTGYQLDPVLGARYLAALVKRSQTFPADVTALQRAVTQSGATDMDAFLALPALDPAAKATATTIVSAWYLGVVGEPADAELITYAEALMYRPTRGILPIPTYGPGPNNWGPKPDSKI